MLTRAGVEAQDSVLGTGVSGGVGSAAIQLAKAREAYVIAATTPVKSDALLELGADETVSRESDLIVELGANNVDVVIDLVVGDKWPHYLDVLCPHGRYSGEGGAWADETFSDVGTDDCGSGYVAGVECSGSYCDNLRLYCKEIVGQPTDTGEGDDDDDDDDDDGGGGGGDGGGCLIDATKH